MLVCAVLAALTSGVLVAYGVCLAMFAAFRIHAAARQVEGPNAGAIQQSPSIAQS